MRTPSHKIYIFMIIWLHHYNISDVPFQNKCVFACFRCKLLTFWVVPCTLCDLSLCEKKKKKKTTNRDAAEHRFGWDTHMWQTVFNRKWSLFFRLCEIVTKKRIKISFDKYLLFDISHRNSQCLLFFYFVWRNFC